MKCEIIKDLLPAYCDGVCSPDAAEEIERHTQNCPDCKRLLEDYRSDVEPLNKSEPQKPFRKIKKKFFRNKSVIVFLIIVLALVLFAVGFLTYGQIVRVPYIPSFETVISSQKAKKIAKKFCEGDIDYVIENVAPYEVNPLLSSDDVKEHSRKVLSDFYGKYFEGKNLTVETHGIFWDGYDEIMYDNDVNPLTEVSILDGGEPLADMSFYERSGGKFELMVFDGGNNTVSETDTGNLNYALSPTTPVDFLETQFLNCSDEVGKIEFYTRDLTDTEEESLALAEKFAAVTKNMPCEKVFYTDFRYDKENERYLADVGYIFCEKSSGKRAVYTRTM
ncbi:MAG: zf-HC2 domain-containing protein, partial [Muribaculaceae bacterium]|nr:zf-HC2 domain-containing protein [Muribaculaceae bacterium]